VLFRSPYAARVRTADSEDAGVALKVGVAFLPVRRISHLGDAAWEPPDFSRWCGANLLLAERCGSL